MFQSMQLNIESPHFIVKQGQITKLATMKPLGVLSIVEEAVGTASYLSSRNDTLEMIKKSDIKIAHMNSLIENSILPKINRISTERELNSIVRSKEQEWSGMHDKVAVFQFLKIRERGEFLRLKLKDGDAKLQERKEEMDRLKEELESKLSERLQAEGLFQEIRNLEGKLEQVKTPFELKEIEYEQCVKRMKVLKEESDKAEESINPL